MLYADTKRLNDKKLLKLERELNRLSKVQRDAPIVPVEEPYQKGWTRHFGLREDILRRKDGHVYKKILAKFNTTIYSRDGKFLDRDGNPMRHDLRILPQREILRYRWDAETMAKVKYGFWPDVRSWHYRQIEGYAFFVPAFWLIEVTEPYIVTHQRVLFPQVETRVKEIMNKLDRDYQWHRLNRLHHGSSHGGWGRYGGVRKSFKELEIELRYGLDPEEE